MLLAFSSFSPKSEHIMSDDGYIKFACNLVPAKSPDFHSIDRLNQWRTRLHEFGLIGVYPDGVGFGNVSLRSTNDQFIISGTATGGLHLLSNHHYVLVESFNLLKNSLTCSGTIKASSESLTHGAIYQANSKIMYILHVHHLGLWETYLHRLPTTPLNVTYGTPEMAYALANLVKQSDHNPSTIVMGGHREGVIVCGEKLDETGNKLVALYRSIQ